MFPRPVRPQPSCVRSFDSPCKGATSPAPPIAHRAGCASNARKAIRRRNEGDTLVGEGRWLVSDSNNAAALFRFDTFEFDRRALELRRGGVKIKLEGQPLRILGMLVERPGELVTREDLRKQLWPGNTIVDFEHSINAAMKRLREALGDSVETSRFIETLPRRGYRFRQPVKSAGAPAVPRPRRYGWQASLVALGVLVIALLAVNAASLRDQFFGPVRANVALAVLPLKKLSCD